MKKILCITLTLLIAIPAIMKAQCNQQLVDIAVQDIKGVATYMKDFKVRLKAQEPRKQQPIAKFSVTMSKGQTYRLSVANAKEYKGQAIIQLYDNDKLQGSSFFKGKDYKFFDFICQKTAPYLIYITFNDGKEGCAVGILSVVKQK
ncbi:MAG: hypothetical protein HY958_07130 [Bacteroidia bacterium]|nr:hypothetical protein [Bacteroidia bacterium]